MPKLNIKAVLANSMILLLPLAVGCGGRGSGSSAASVTAPPAVYTVGTASSGATRKAVVWMNGTPVELTDGTTAALADSVYVSGSTVYVAGQQNNSAGLGVAMIWTWDMSAPFAAASFTPWALTDGSNDAKVDSIIVVGSQVYASGYESNGDFNVAKVWAPSLTSAFLPGATLAAVLSDGTAMAEANLLVASGTMVYAAGYDEMTGAVSSAANMGPLGTNDPTCGVAMVWSYDTTTPFGVPAFIAAAPLSDGTMDANVNEITVTGTQILAAGYQYNGTKDVATVWTSKLGVPSALAFTATALSDGTSEANANTIVASSSMIYTAGYDGNFAKQWSAPLGTQNLTTTRLSDGTQAAQAQSLFLYGGNVYDAGWISIGTQNVAQVWINGTASALQDGTAATQAYSIFVAPSVLPQAPVNISGQAATAPTRERY